MSKVIDWYYHRRSCDTCKRSQSFLRNGGYTIRDTTDAKQKFDREASIKILREISQVTLTRGTKVLRYDLGEPGQRDEALNFALGRAGTLRAPALRVGKHLYVGFPKGGFSGL
ncbi:MAG: ArsC family (seleno)protein [Nannocystaceae bacterium]